MSDSTKKPEDLLYWMGKDVKTMTRDELESALRLCATLYHNALEERLRQGRFTADIMRMAARR